MLDQHRQGMAGQMRADLQNYLVAKSQGLVGSAHNSKRSRYNSSMKSGTSSHASMAGARMDGHISIRNDRLVRNTPMVAGGLKPLHDSCYVSPEQNHRVIQDNHGGKIHAWEKALQRHEAQIQSQKNFNEVVVSKHFERIQNDEGKLVEEVEMKRAKKKRFYDDIQR